MVMVTNWLAHNWSIPLLEGLRFVFVIFSIPSQITNPHWSRKVYLTSGKDLKGFVLMKMIRIILTVKINAKKNSFNTEKHRKYRCGVIYWREFFTS